MGIEKPICLTQAVEQTSPTLHDITTSSSRIKEAARTPGQHNKTFFIYVISLVYQHTSWISSIHLFKSVYYLM